MIGALRVENFKAFRSAEFDFRPLTVLTGLNSTGKSTVIQALLLTQLAIELGGQRVPLNGPYGLAMGEALDVLNSSAELQTITFELSGPRGQELAVLGVPNDRAVALDVVQFGQPAGLLPPSRRTCGHLPQRRAPRPARPAGDCAGQRFAHRCRSSGPVHGARTCAVRTYDHPRIAAAPLDGRGWTGDHAGGPGSGVAIEHCEARAC